MNVAGSGARRGTGDTRTPMLANLIAIGSSVFPWGMYCASGWDGERWESSVSSHLIIYNGRGL